MKKKNDILHMAVLKPSLCILDEIDSGVDVDSIKIIVHNINIMRNNKRSFIIFTHYKKFLDYINPNYIHILYKGNIINTGNFSLVKEIEFKGYVGLFNKQN